MTGVFALLLCVGCMPPPPAAPLGPIAFEDNAVEQFGRVSASAPVYRFLIGPIDAGDFLEVRVDATGSLDPLVAVFDPQDQILGLNDDDPLLETFNSRLTLPVRRSHDFLAIEVAGFGDSTGEFTVTATRTPNGDAGPPEAGQFVYVDLRGATGFDTPLTGPIDIPPFDEAMLGAGGRRGELIDRIMDEVRAKFVGYNIRFATSDDGPPPSDGDFSIVYVGGDGGNAGEGLLGFAESLDFGNLNQRDRCFVFAENFAVLGDDFEILVSALANVIAHEVGHLLGLVHTNMPEDVMESTSNFSAIFTPQIFTTAEIIDFPSGIQNGRTSLADALGSTPNAQPSTKAIFPTEPRTLDPSIQLPAVWCGTCGRFHK